MIQEIEKMVEVFDNNVPTSITDTKGRVWESEVLFYGAIKWDTLYLQENLTVMCTPFWDGEMEVTAQMTTTEDGEFIQCETQAVVGADTNEELIENTINALKVVLGRLLLTGETKTITTRTGLVCEYYTTHNDVEVYLYHSEHHSRVYTFDGKEETLVAKYNDNVELIKALASI